MFALRLPFKESIHYRVIVDGITYEDSGFPDGTLTPLSIWHWATHVRKASITVGMYEDSPYISGQENYADNWWNDDAETFTKVYW